MAFSSVNVIAGAFSLMFLALLVSHYGSKLCRRPPPGPPGLPIVGNVCDIPAPHESPWLKYHDWCLEYNSDIIRLNALGVNIVVLNTLEAARELLDRRSALYSDRPRMTMWKELAGFGWQFGTRDNDEDWRISRKMAHHEFHPAGFKKYRSILARNAHDLVRRLTQESVVRVRGHVKHMTGANILEVTYGIEALPEHDPFLELADVNHDAINECFTGFFLVDVFPLLKYMPSWLPGAGFKRQAAVWRESATRQLHVPYADYVRREELGKASDCMAKALSDAFGTDESNVRYAKMATASMYMGGTETIAAVLHWFFLAMLLYPDIQTRARRELEAALDAHYLPTFEDFGSVPYIDALIKELFRWQPVGRLNAPHRLREDDVYNGFHLEKDSLVLVNTWSILHDENVFPDPDTFAPDRFLKSDGTLNPDILDPQDITFGFGRRACPGAHMAYDTLWITIATVLVCTEICPAKDSEGRGVEVKEEYISSFVTEPRPFPCCIRFRSEGHAALFGVQA